MFFGQKKKGTVDNVLQPKTRENIVNTQIIIIVMGVLVLFSQCSSSSNIRKLANSTRTSVQLNNGQTVITEAKPGYYRSPVVIKEFCQQWYNLMLGWDTSQNPVKLDRNIEIPANTYAASQMMSLELQTSFLTEFETLIKKTASQEKKTIQSSPRITYISEPIEVGEGKWKVNIVANWIIFDSSGSRQLNNLTFNKTLTLESSVIPTKTLSEENDLQLLINSLRTSGLEITAIEEFKG